MTQQQPVLTEIKPRFVVETPPFMHKNYNVSGMMRDTLLALAPAALMAVYYYGLPAVRVMALAAGGAVLTQYLWEKALGRESRIYDCTALVTGLLFAFLLPAGAPWWLILTGIALTMILGREIFGGLGCNPLCPPLIGWAILTISWPTFMDPAAMNLNSDFIDPLIKMKYFGPQSLPEGSEMGLLFGQQLAGLGSGQILAVIIGGMFLCLRGAVRWEVPLSFIISVLGCGALFWLFGESWGINPANTPAPHLYLLTGSTLFAAFFLATDHASSPVASGGMLLYGLFCGFMVVMIRIFGIYPDGAPFAVLVAALGTPLFDLIRVQPFGHRGGKRI